MLAEGSGSSWHSKGNGQVPLTPSLGFINSDAFCIGQVGRVRKSENEALAELISMEMFSCYIGMIM